MLDRYRERGWIFDYSPETLFVTASHPNGGKATVCEISFRSLLKSERDEIGNTIADLLNGKSVIQRTL